MRRHLLRSGLILAWGLCWSASARAQSFSLELADRSSCTTQEALEGQVLARTRRRGSAPSAGTFHFEVRIAAQSHNGVAATLLVHSPQRRSSTRSIEGETCGEVVSALALIMALTLDPYAQTETTEKLSESVRAATPDAEHSQQKQTEGIPTEKSANIAAPPRHPSTNTQPRSSTNDAPTVPLHAALHSPSLDQAHPQTHGSPSNRPPVSIAVGTQAEWTSPLGPRFGLFYPGIHGTFALRSGPIATLAVGMWPATRRSSGDGVAATLSYYGAALDVGWPILTRDSFVLDLLSIVSIGRLHAAGSPSDRIAVSREATATWFGLGPGAELRHHLGWGGWTLQAAVPIGISRPDFVLVRNGSESGRFHRASAIGLQLSLRLFVRCLG